MTFVSKIKKALIATALGVGVVAMAAAPAQAGSLERGLLAGLIGGVALSALAASALAQQQGGPVFATLPADLDAPVYVDEIGPEVRPLRQRRLRPQQRRISTQRPSPAVRRSAEATKCAAVLEARARELGAIDVKVSSAGSEVRGRDGARVLPINARIEYARKGLGQVRQARVGCRVNTEGQVVELQ